MEIVPILSALRKNKIGSTLMVLQVAMVVALLSNLFTIVLDRLALLSRSTGTVENQLFALGYRTTAADGRAPPLEVDLNAIRSVPGVVDVVASNTYPLRGTDWVEGVSVRPGAKAKAAQNAQSAIYAWDAHGIPTLGLQLLAGRNFFPSEVIHGNFNAAPIPSVAIISKALSRQLFGSASPLGKMIYLTSDVDKPVAVVGLVERLQSGSAATSTDPEVSESTLILPIVAENGGALFIVRANPASMNQIMHAVQERLLAVSVERTFGRLRPFTEVRKTVYAKDRSMAAAFVVVFVVLVVVTLLGNVSLTTFWVMRRRRHIGIRRALGATRRDILRYFLLENALLCAMGTLLGVLGSMEINTWLRVHYASGGLSMPAVVSCAVLAVIVGQFAALSPALRASKVDPSHALRGA